MLTRNLSLREVLPPSALAAGYSVMYAAVGAGYAATGSLAGALLHFVAPSTAILAGVALTLALTAVGAVGEGRSGRRAAAAPASSTGAHDTVVGAAPAAGPGSVAGPEGAAIGRGGDPEGGL
jgi:hypothetical protein